LSSLNGAVFTLLFSSNPNPSSLLGLCDYNGDYMKSCFLLIAACLDAIYYETFFDFSIIACLMSCIFDIPN